MTRAFGGHHDDHHHGPPKSVLFGDDETFVTGQNFDIKPSVEIEPGVVVPDFVPTLEWVLDSPPNIHQFEEPPVRLNTILLVV